MKIINNKEYYTATELLENKKIKKRFKNVRNIGYFVMLFFDKLDFVKTRRTTLIYKDLFLKVLLKFEKI